MIYQIMAQSKSKLGAEFIYLDNMNNTINKEYDYDEDMTDVIRRLNNIDHLLCLDLHGVADQYSTDYKISKLPICIISYVGKHSKNREIAKNDLKQRLKNRTIIMGILVFKRYDEPHKKYRYSGSKSWMLNLFKLIYPNMKIDFIDDGSDHINLTNIIIKENNLKYINTHKVESNDTSNINKIIKNAENNQTGGRILNDIYAKYMKYKKKYLDLKKIENNVS